MICRGCGRDFPQLCEAHIIPRGFARDVMADQTHNIQASLANAKPTQHGVYDRNILCAACDGKLGMYDDYALEVCRRFESEHTTDRETFSLSNVDGEKFAKFVIAVLWRASISSRPEFKAIFLGPYENSARDVLLNDKCLRDFPAIQVMVSRYKELREFNVKKIYTLPTRVSNLGVNGWGFALSGFRIYAKIDKRPWPIIPAEAAKLYVINGNDTLRGLFVDFHDSGEYRALIGMVKARIEREQTRKKKD